MLSIYNVFLAVILFLLRIYYYNYVFCPPACSNLFFIIIV